MEKRVSIIYWVFFLICYLGIQPILSAEEPLHSVDQIRRELGRYMSASEGARDKHITVFIGNAGVGKSTLINLAAGFPLRINSSGKIDLVGNIEGAARSGGGTSSITDCPRHFYSREVGDMYDLPGFMDTAGTVKEILNASAIRGVLTNARGVRVMFVMNTGELEEAARGRLSKDFDKAVGMFGENFLRGPSCAVIVNSVDREIVDQNPQDPNILSLLKNLENIGKIQNKILLKKARVGDQTPFIYTLKDTLFQSILSIRYNPVGALNMSRTFIPETSIQIAEFFRDCMKQNMEEKKDERFKAVVENIERNISAKETLVSTVFETKFLEMWNQFKNEFMLTPEYKLLYEICAEQYSKALEGFRPTFDYELKSALSYLKLKEKEQAKEAAEAAKKEAEEREQAAKDEAEAAQKQAEQYRKEKEDAQQQERIARTEAEAAQADATKSQEEKEHAREQARQAFDQLRQAQAGFDNFRLEYQEKERLAKEETENLKKANEDFKKKCDDLEKAYKERDQEMREALDKMMQEKKQISKDLEELKDKNDAASKEFKEKLAEQNRDYKRSIRDMESRHAREMAERNSRRRSGGGFCTIL